MSDRFENRLKNSGNSRVDVENTADSTAFLLVLAIVLQLRN
ncbi:hypothetical protein [Ammoniphilus sp. YIM 78166]|nr:hypothetical protein [Ammoniphilus sp. YIM 78166]